jgi:hypothetical protein
MISAAPNQTDLAKLSKRDFWKSNSKLMKISNFRIEKIKGLIQDISELDKLIALHRQHSSDDFMVSQYEVKKYDRFQQLIRQLMHPSLNREGFSTYPLVQQLTERFYPAAKSGALKNGDLRVLEEVVG